MHSNYYEAILQIRPASKEVERFLEKKFETTTRARMTHKKKIKTGSDYYITSWKFAVSLGNELRKKFGGFVTISKKIYGKSKKKGKVVYRCTVLYRRLAFRKGDVISFDRKVYKITSTNKIITGMNLQTGKKEKIDGTKKWNVEEPLKEHVSIQDPLHVIDSEDYQIRKVENMSRSKKKVIKIVKVYGKVYSVN